jgi:hypothetical protein
MSAGPGTSMAPDELLGLLCQLVIGKPAADCGYVDVLHVRDDLDRLLNGEVDKRQADAGSDVEAAS